LDKNFNNDKQIGYLLFNNGVLDMKNFKMLEFNQSYKFTHKINRDFIIKDYNTDTVLNKIFKSVFLNEDKLNYIIQLLCRGIAGEYFDKSFLFYIGKTNCGKTKLIKYFENTFQDYIGAFNAEHLIKKNSSNNMESEREWSFVKNCYSKRIAFTSELQLKSESSTRLTKLDGNKIKTLSSGGDVIEMRDLYKQSGTVINKSLIVGCLNDLLEIDPADEAVIGRVSCITADRSSSKTIKIDNEKFFVADNTIENFINDINRQNELIALLCNRYIIPIMDRPNCVKSETMEYVGSEESGDKWLKMNYEYNLEYINWKTNCEWDCSKYGNWWISFDSIYKHYLLDGNSSSKTNFGKMLNDYSDSAMIKKKRVRIGIRIKQNDEE
jgi:hypothetical protein